MNKIRKNDTVYILSGSDKGKQGKVLHLVPKKNLIKVAGIAIVTKHSKARKQGDVPSIKHIESYIKVSKVMLVSPHDSKPSRVGFRILENGKKVRVCKRTNEIIDQV